MIRAPREPIFGAVPADRGVRFCLWAPGARRVDLHRQRPGGQVSMSALVPQALRTGGGPDAVDVDGIWRITVAEAAPGDRYAFSIDGGRALPDPAARFLPEGVHGWAEVVDSREFAWTDAEWCGLDPGRAIIYELHVGTFTPEGSFRGAAERLPYLRDLGVTAIELMPVAAFAGRRNWGYDGVALFAPCGAYGRPDDLRALVNAAHEAKLAVILDVVYNHLGPDGAYLPGISPLFLTERHTTPWGRAVNLDDEGSAAVRSFLADNALHWIDEYHIDGLRLDATHALIDSRPLHFVAELAGTLHAAAVPPPLLYAEDHRNLAALVEAPERGGWGLDGIWADDFHHIIRRMLAGDRHGYYADYEGTAAELASTLRHGWLYAGQHSQHHGCARGTDPSHVPMRKAVVCVQNHDQVGNRPLGDRLHQSVDPAAWRAAVAVLLTAPMTPLVFMGQEWASSAPFQFFTDFDPELGKQVVDGRRRELRAFPLFATEESARQIPDPQDPGTFDASRLRWAERGDAGHTGVLALHRALLRLRRDHAALGGSEACECAAAAIGEDTVTVRRSAPGTADLLVVARLRGAGSVAVAEVRDAGRRMLLDTEDPEFTPDPLPAQVDRGTGVIAFRRAGALVFGGGLT